jgi:hypothetical protein
MCDPATLAIAAVSAGTSAIAGSRGGGNRQPAVAPAKTDADVARAAEDERRRLGYGGPRSFSNNFVSFGTPTTSDNVPLKRVSLGA